MVALLWSVLKFESDIIRPTWSTYQIYVYRPHSIWLVLTLINMGGGPGVPLGRWLSTISDWLEKMSSYLVTFNPISLGGGTLCPPTQSILCGNLGDAPTLLPLHDFVPLNLSQALLESFFGFIFQNFEKIGLEDTWSASILTQKLKKSKKIEFFCRKSYFFLLNLNSTWS